MKRRIHDALLGIVGLAGVAFLALSGVSCEKPTMQCAVGHGPFIATYAVVTGDAACYPGGTYEEIGFATYLQSKPTTTVITKASDGEDIKILNSAGADYNNRKIAIQSTTFGDLLRGRSGAGLKDTGAAYMFGDYTNDPDSNNICYAFGNGEATTNVAELDADAFDTGELDDMMMPIILPAVHYRQTWKDVRLYVTEGVPGTQAVGQMTFENLTVGAECSVTFKFVSLYPAAHCEVEILIDRQVDNDKDPMTPIENDTDDDKNPMTPVNNDKDDDKNPMTPVEDDDGKPGPDVDADPIVIGDVVRTELDAELCNPVAEEGWVKPPAGTEYKAARITGSGINPDFKTKCDPDLLYCVLDETPLTGAP